MCKDTSRPENISNSMSATRKIIKDSIISKLLEGELLYKVNLYALEGRALTALLKNDYNLIVILIREIKLK